MIAGLVVLAVIFGAVYHQYLKGTVIRAFIMLISAISAMTVAMNYYEVASELLLAKGYGGVWAAPGVLVGLFVVTFFILKTVMELFLGEPLHFSNLVDRAVCSLCGVFTAIIFMGIILIALAMVPVLGKWPYQRFDVENPNMEEVSKVLIPADDFVAGLFSTISSGAFSTNNSFSAVRPDFVNQLYANRQKSSDGVLNIAAKDCIVIKKNSVWKDQSLKDASTGDLFSSSPEGPTVVRFAIKSGEIKDGGAMDADGKMNFTLAQIKLFAVEKTNPSQTTAFSPAGYIKTKGLVQPAKLFETIETTRGDFKTQQNFNNTFLIDLVFDVPSKYKPVAITFRNNAIAKLPNAISADQKPEAISFVQASKCETQKATLTSISAKIRPIQLTAKRQLMLGLTINAGNISDIDKNTELDEDGYSVANIKISPTDKQKERGRRANTISIPSLLAPMSGFAKVALKCDIKAGSKIEASDFPVLEELTGQKHYPVGVFVGGSSNGIRSYQLTYCSQLEKLTIKNDRVAKSYPQNIWITDKIDKVTNAFFIYLIKPSKSNIIVKVTSGDKTARFKDTQGFIVPTGR